MTAAETSLRPSLLTVALAGNPNVGKSTLFNALTGMHQHVGNWTGKTVERMEGDHVAGDRRYRLIDLPGAYSLSAWSPEELIAREFIAREHPDVVVNVVDASNLERNLYLTLQLLELTPRVVVALNMMDLAERRGQVIDVAALEARLGVPVVAMIAERKDGHAAVLAAIEAVANGSYPLRPLRTSAPPTVSRAVDAIVALMPTSALAGFSPQWFARKLLEGDVAVVERASLAPELHEARLLAESLQVEPELSDLEAAGIESQYAVVSEVMAGVVHLRPGATGDWTDALDRVMTHRLASLPILLAIFGGMFVITFSAAKPLTDGLATWLHDLGHLLEGYLVALHAPFWLSGILIEGIWAGFSVVAGFFPTIAIFFTLFAILEDSGYLARAAFVVDRLMGAIGLHGRSFLPLLMGFGCNVPAVMATRIMENRADRLMTILLNPLMLCQARLVVFVFFVGTFYTGWRATAAMLSLYVLSVVLLLATSLVFKKTLFPGEPAPFIMELPPYHVPIARNVLAHAWRSARGFLKRAATQITGMTAVIWVFTHLPPGNVEASFAGQVGHAIAWVGVPMGLDWRLLVSLLGGFLAKEGALAALAVLYGVGQGGLGGALRAALGPLSAYSFMVVSLLYVPCFSTLVAIWRETLSWKWTLLASTYGLVLAMILGTLVYQGGHLLGLG